jgi:pimeloyl-ACP methyl ester carboxylesterase
MAAFVLVHGAFGSWWHWSRLAPLLRAAGHDVYAPTLTGLGARAHLATPSLGLATHVDDVVGVLEYEDLHGVVLVGWSYGGMVVAGAADRAPARLAHVVHVDAYCPRDGQAAADQQPPPYRAQRESLLRTGVWLAPPPGEESLAGYVERGQLSAEEVRAFVARLRPQPVKTFLDPLRLTNPAAAAVPRTYVYCRQNAGDAWRAAELRGRSGWGYRELDADHLAPFTHPRLVADLLLEIAGSGRRYQPRNGER